MNEEKILQIVKDALRQYFMVGTWGEADGRELYAINQAIENNEINELTDLNNVKYGD